MVNSDFIGSQHRWALFLVFLLLLFAATPSNFHYRSAGSYDPTARYVEDLRFDNKNSALTNNTRLGGALIGLPIAAGIEALAKLFQTENKNYFNPKSTDLLPSNAFMDSHQQSAVVYFLATAIYRTVVLLPVFFLGLLLFEGVLGATVFYMFMFLVLTGYGAFQDWLATDVFLTLKKDQWHPFWEFQRMQDPEYFDLLAIGYLALLAIIMIKGRAHDPILIAPITAFGQLSFEHLGFITGVSLALFLLLTANRNWSDRLVRSLKVLVLCGAITILVIAGMAATLLLMGHSVEFFLGGQAGFNVADITETGNPNRENYRYLLFRAAYYFAVPAVFGVIFGIFIATLKIVRKRRSAPSIVPIAFLSLFLGFMVAAAVGFFTGINYAAENGRELMPGAVLLLCFSASFTEYMLIALFWRTGSQLIGSRTH